MYEKYLMKFDLQGGFMKENSYPDMREKVKEYISELEAEINRCESAFLVEKTPYIAQKYIVRAQTLSEVVNDLNGRLEERI